MIGGQNLIVYERDGRAIVYSTAYTEDETKQQVFLCATRYGRGARVRSVPADQYPLSAS